MSLVAQYRTTQSIVYAPAEFVVVYPVETDVQGRLGYGSWHR